VIAAIQQAIALKTQYNIRVINLSLGRGVAVAAGGTRPVPSDDAGHVRAVTERVGGARHLVVNDAALAGCGIAEVGHVVDAAVNHRHADTPFLTIVTV
jgi:hypothetical protein